MKHVFEQKTIFWRLKTHFGNSNTAGKAKELLIKENQLKILVVIRMLGKFLKQFSCMAKICFRNFWNSLNACLNKCFRNFLKQFKCMAKKHFRNFWNSLNVWLNKCFRNFWNSLNVWLNKCFRNFWNSLNVWPKNASEISETV